MTHNSTRRLGAAALDEPLEHGNVTRKYVSPKDADEYLRMRRAELACRRTGVALRHLREARGMARDVLAKEIGVSKGTLEGLEAGDPMVGVGMWIKAWRWMGVYEQVDAVACAGTQSMGDAALAFRKEARYSQEALAKIIHCKRGTIRKVEASSHTVGVHTWIDIWRAMGIKDALVECADPHLRIRLEDAEAAARRAPTVAPPSVEG